MLDIIYSNRQTKPEETWANLRAPKPHMMSRCTTYTKPKVKGPKELELNKTPERPPV